MNSLTTVELITNNRKTPSENLSPFLGNVLFVSDTSGNINTSYVQEGFGNVIVQSGSANNSYHLTTKEIDSNTALYYFNARWYDSQVGRFISQDPKWSFNLYSYVENNPINAIDPDGLCVKLCRRAVFGLPGAFSPFFHLYFKFNDNNGDAWGFIPDHWYGIGKAYVKQEIPPFKDEKCSCNLVNYSENCIRAQLTYYQSHDVPYNFFFLNSNYWAAVILSSCHK